METGAQKETVLEGKIEAQKGKGVSIGHTASQAPVESRATEAAMRTLRTNDGVGSHNGLLVQPP